ncbi:MAG: acyl-homoserine-lactone synthase [Rhodospirillaceae bacterium]
MDVVPFLAQTRPDLMALSWRLRHDVFAEALGWELPTQDSLDIDPYDMRASHVCLVENANVIGYLRALPTTGPYLLKDCFPVLAGGNPPEDSSLWEISRFAVSPKLERSYSSDVARTLVRAGVAMAVDLGAKGLIAVTEPAFARFLENCGLRIEKLCQTQVVGQSTRGPVKALGIACALDRANILAMDLAPSNAEPLAENMDAA